MIRESLEEYKEICGLVRESSASVMRYSSTAVAISGTIFAAIASFEEKLGQNGLVPVTLLALANVTLFIQLIINYKCSSHNRLAAYRNLIAAERFDEEAIEKGVIKRDEEPAVAFDVCMNHLNHTYAKGEFDFDLVKGEFFGRKGVFGKLTGEHDIDLFVSGAFPRKVKHFEGAAGVNYGAKRQADYVWRWLAIPFFLFCLMTGLYKRKGTWSFPDQVNRMIGFIVLMELTVAGYFFVEKPISWSSSPLSFSTVLALVAIAVILLQNVSIQWQELMIGGKRIFSYFVQFVPFRMIYIKQMFGLQAPGDDRAADPTHITYFVGTEWELD